MKCYVTRENYYTENIHTWCTNCGNYGIHGALKNALVSKCISPKNTVLCFDIGCNGNGSDKIKANIVHGLHGRVIPFASGVSIANRDLHVIAFGGDGGTLSEGINHLLSAIRYDFNFTFVLHNNFNFALTKGQNSPSTKIEKQLHNPIDVMKLVFSLNPSFVARGLSADTKQLQRIFEESLDHKGFSFIEVYQDCPTYNRTTDHKDLLTRYFDVSRQLNYKVSDLEVARKLALEKEKIATGVIYKDDRRCFYRKYHRWSGDSELVEEVQNYDISGIFGDFR